MKNKIWKRIVYGLIGASAIVYAFNLLPAYVDYVKWITIAGAANWLWVAVTNESEKDVTSLVNII